MSGNKAICVGDRVRILWSGESGTVESVSIGQSPQWRTEYRVRNDKHGSVKAYGIGGVKLLEEPQPMASNYGYSFLRDQTTAQRLDAIEANVRRFDERLAKQRVDIADDLRAVDARIENLSDHAKAASESYANTLNRITSLERTDSCFGAEFEEIASRLTSLEKNPANHESAIGALDEETGLTLAERVEMLRKSDEHLEALCASHQRRTEEVAERASIRLGDHFRRLGALEEDAANRGEDWANALELLNERVARLESAKPPTVSSGEYAALSHEINHLSADHMSAYKALYDLIHELQLRLEFCEHVTSNVAPDREHLVDRLDALEQAFQDREDVAKKLRNGPRSYDKRIAAIERKIKNGFGIEVAGLIRDVQKMATLSTELDDLRHEVNALKANAAPAAHWGEVMVHPPDGLVESSDEDVTASACLVSSDANRSIAQLNTESSVDEIAAYLRDVLVAEAQCAIDDGYGRPSAANSVLLLGSRLKIAIDAAALDVTSGLVA